MEISERICSLESNKPLRYHPCWSFLQQAGDGGPIGWVSPRDWLGSRLCPHCDVCGLFPALTCVFPSLADLSAAKRKFADSLNEFKFRCIGDAETDDEICIGESRHCPHGARGPHSRALSSAGHGGQTCTRTPRGPGVWVLPCSLEMANFSWFNITKTSQRN